MDDRQLRDGLKGAPPPDEGARERTIARALAEFRRAQKEKTKTPQGFSLPGRLMGGLNHFIRRRTMHKQALIGGVGIALTAALAVGIGLRQFQLFESEPLPLPEPASSPALESEVAEVVRNKSVETKEEALNSLNLEVHERILDEPQILELADALAPRALSRSTGSQILERPASRADSDAIVPAPDPGRDRFTAADPNPVRVVREHPVSTFSVDVDTAAYAFVRRSLRGGVLPPKDAVRIEEMINYFNYHYPLPDGKAQPFRPAVSVFPAPWNPANRLLHIGIQGFDIPPRQAPAANLVFLLDVSGSMDAPDKLPLVKNSMKLLLESLKPDDSVAIVVYAGAAGTVLAPTAVRERAKILNALEDLRAGGSTAGAEGIRRAYQLAESRFDPDAVNRIILATDGDFNVGISDPEQLKGFIERKRKSGIFLSVLGFGQGNLNDHLMQQLAQNGNGVAAYIDTLNEARKVLVEEASSTLFPIATDVKIQVEFNPAVVAEYRLIGYETRALKREDFRNDAVDAGDIGAGHSVTALYEITPLGGAAQLVEPLRYGQAEAESAAGSGAGSAAGSGAGEYAFLKIRYKRPGEDTSNLITSAVAADNERPPAAGGAGIDCAPPALREDRRCRARAAGWAVAVAAFAQLLRGGQYTGAFDYDDVITLAERHKGPDPFGYRAEFIQLVRLAKSAAAMQAQ